MAGETEQNCEKDVLRSEEDVSESADRKGSGGASTDNFDTNNGAEIEDTTEQKQLPPPDVSKSSVEEFQDASEDTRDKVSKDEVGINIADSTLNVLASAGNKLLMSLTDGGFQYLLAGIRANTGIKAGRYMFEAQVVETSGPFSEARSPSPRHLLRVGLSTSSSSLLLGDGESTSISFDTEGVFAEGSVKKCVSQRISKGTVIAVVVNLESTPAANTINLFVNGVRACPPQLIPERMLGKPLYPTLTYKNVSVRVNFGANSLAPLPFRCHMLSCAAVSDVEIAKPVANGDERPHVLLPVGIPDQGFFDWVDFFLEKNPDYIELSDRKVLDWASRSGVPKPKGIAQSADRPDLKFGLPGMDDMSIKRLIAHLTPLARKNFIIPELRGNLTEADRKEVLARFPSSFRKTATIFMGEPNKEYIDKVHEKILQEKKNKLESKRNILKRLTEETALKKARISDAPKDAEKMGQEEATAVDGMKEEAANAPAQSEEVVELTEEEKRQIYRKCETPEMTESAIAKIFAKFTLPKNEEGFDDICYAWQPASETQSHLKTWIYDNKMKLRVDDLKPGESFDSALAAWKKQLSGWRQLHVDWNDPQRKKVLLKKRDEERLKLSEEERAKDLEIDIEDVEPLEVEDVNDVGTGEPLFANFVFEDWVLLSARFELHLLLHSFRQDLNDPDRPSFTEQNLAFYFNIYHKKAFSLKSFAADKLQDLLKLIGDTICVDEQTRFLKPVLPEETPLARFVQETEEARRARTRRSEAGDETAEITFPRSGPAQAYSRQPRGEFRNDEGDRSSNRGFPPPSRHHTGTSYQHGSRSTTGYARPNDSFNGNGNSGSTKRTSETSDPYRSKQARTSSYGAPIHRGGSHYRR